MTITESIRLAESRIAEAIMPKILSVLTGMADEVQHYSTQVVEGVYNREIKRLRAACTYLSDELEHKDRAIWSSVGCPEKTITSEEWLKIAMLSYKEDET